MSQFESTHTHKANVSIKSRTKFIIIIGGGVEKKRIRTKSTILRKKRNVFGAAHATEPFTYTHTHICNIYTYVCVCVCCVHTPFNLNKFVIDKHIKLCGISLDGKSAYRKICLKNEFYYLFLCTNIHKYTAEQIRKGLHCVCVCILEFCIYI